MHNILLLADFNFLRKQTIDYCIDFFGLKETNYVFLDVSNAKKNYSESLISFDDIVSKTEAEKTALKLEKKLQDILPADFSYKSYSLKSNPIEQILSIENIDYIFFEMYKNNTSKLKLINPSSQEFSKKFNCPVTFIPEI